MTRYMAIQSVPGLTEQEFRQVFSTPRGWKPGGGATILKVYCDLDRGKGVHGVRGGPAVPFRGLDETGRLVL